MKDINELRRKRAALVNEARAILDTVESEKRDLSAEENKKYDETMTDVDKLKDEIEREERQQALEKELDASQNEPNKPDADVKGGDNRSVNPRSTEEYKDAFRRFIRSGYSALGEKELRALQVDSDMAGGYLISPETFATELIKKIDDLVFIRQFANVQTITNSTSLGAPALDNDPADSDWTSEIATGSEDSTMSLGKRSLTSHPLAKRIKVSNTLLRLSSMGAENLVRDRLAYKFAITQEKAFLTGSGSQQPLGVFTASARGISTARDVSTGNTATSIAFDGLKEAKYTLKAQYRPRARWLFHRDAVKQVDKLKDTTNQYIWQPSTQQGQPDRLLNIPVLESEYAPNTFTASQYVGVLGDFLTGYWIVDALDIQIQRLVELYAETNQVGFIGRLESDGMPVLEECFVRVKLAAS